MPRLEYQSSSGSYRVVQACRPLRELLIHLDSQIPARVDRGSSTVRVEENPGRPGSVALTIAFPGSDSEWAYAVISAEDATEFAHRVIEVANQSRAHEPFYQSVEPDDDPFDDWDSAVFVDDDTFDDDYDDNPCDCESCVTSREE